MAASQSGCLPVTEVADMAENMSPGLFRRLGAILYDSLLLTAVLMLSTAALLPLTHGEPIPAGNFYYQALLLILCAVFFVGFWVRAGQTLGMRAWRLRVCRLDGAPLRWPDGLARLAAAVLSWAAAGLGFVWVLFDRDRLAWHDRLSRTRLIYVPGPRRR